MPTDFRKLLQMHTYCHEVRDYIAHFANPVRLKILCALVMDEATVGELVVATETRQTTVSQHLKILRLAGLVARQQSGNKRVYRVVDPLVFETMGFLASVAEQIVERKTTTNRIGEPI